MKIRNGIRIKGRMSLKVFGPDGRLKEQRLVENVITDLGCAHVADQMSDQGNAALSHMAVGSGTGGTTTLNSEEARVALDSTTQGTGASDHQVVYVATFGAGVGTAALTEAGILNADVDGVLFNYAEFSAINKGASDSLEITWTVSFADDGA